MLGYLFFIIINFRASLLPYDKKEGLNILNLRRLQILQIVLMNFEHWTQQDTFADLHNMTQGFRFSWYKNHKKKLETV
jgi:hypothetical protein